MEAYKPEEGGGGGDGEGEEVAPLVGFFELVHVGDTIQSMVDVYFEKEIVSSFSIVSIPHRFTWEYRHDTLTEQTS
jgi:hypothetical protein